MCSPGNPLKKLGKVAEAQPKSTYPCPRYWQSSQAKKLQSVRSLCSDGVERPDFEGDSSGGQSFCLWYLLYATSRSFWSKNFDWTVFEAQKELCMWIGFPQRSLGFLLLFGLWGLAECYQKCSVRLYYGFLSARINEYLVRYKFRKHWKNSGPNDGFAARSALRARF